MTEQFLERLPIGFDVVANFVIVVWTDLSSSTWTANHMYEVYSSTKSKIATYRAL